MIDLFIRCGPPVVMNLLSSRRSSPKSSRMAMSCVGSRPPARALFCKSSTDGSSFALMVYSAPFSSRPRRNLRGTGRVGLHDLLGDGRHDELWDLAGATNGETSDFVFEGRVPEAVKESVAVLVDVDSRDRGKQRLDFLLHDVPNELAEHGVGEDLVDVLESCEVSKVGNGRVRGVQQPQLVHLELLNVVY
ncbi:Mannitol [Hortaea werneckii]|nr:Mannitol [Hortaea werneckii]